MTGDVTGIGEFVHEAIEGQIAVVAALVIVLHENGILPQDKYSEALHRLWMAMPEDEAVGEAGAVIERMLDLLGTRACAATPPTGGDSKQKAAVFARRHVNGGGIAQPAPESYSSDGAKTSMGLPIPRRE